MKPAKHTTRYLLLVGLALVLGGVVYVAGQTPRVIETILKQVSRELKQRHGIEFQLKQITVEGFLTIRADGLYLTKKDIGLSIQAQAIRAKLSPWQYLKDGNPVSRLEIDSPEVTADLTTFMSASEKGSKPNFKIDWTLSELKISNGRAELKWDKKVIQILKLETQASITPRLVNLHLLSIETPEFKLITDGKIGLANRKQPGLGSELRFWLSGSLQDIPEIRQLEIPFEGDLELQGQLIYLSRKQGPLIKASLLANKIRIDDVVIHELSGPIILNKKFLELRGLEAKFAGGRPQVSGKLYFNDNLTFTAEVTGKELSLYDLLSDVDVKDSWVELKLTTHAIVSGQVFPEFSLNGSAKGVADNLVLKENKKKLILKTANPIKFKTELGVTKKAFQFRKAEFEDGESRFIADCDLYFKRPGMSLKANLEKINFKSINQKLAGDVYKGVGKADLSIEGLYEGLLIQAKTKLKSFQFNEFRFGSIEGLFSLSDNKITVSNIEGKQRSLLYSGSLGVTLGQTPTEISLNAHLKSGMAEDLRTFIVPEIKTLDWSGPLEGNIALLGPIEKGYQQELTGQLNIKILNGTKLFGAEVESGQLIASMDKSTVTLSELALHSKQGKAVLFADFNKKTELGTGTLKLTDSFLGAVDMTMGFKPGLVHINGAALESKAIVQSTITLNKSLPFQVQVSVPYGNLSTLFPKLRWLEDYQVQSGIRARAEGLLTELEKSTVSLELFPAIFHLGTLRLLSTKTVQASYQKETLHIGSTVFRSIHGDEIEISATATEKDIDLALNASADLWFLTHLDERIEGAYGDLKANIKLNGPWSNISTLGNIKIAPKSYISLRDYPPGLTQLEGNVELTGKNGIINLKGQASQGQFSLNGIIGLSNNFFDGIHLELSKMPIYYSTYLTGVATGHLDLEGPWAEPTLSGDINFSEVLFTKDLTPAELRAPRSRAKKQPLKLDITLASETPVRVESQSFNGDLKGNLRLTGTLNSPGLIGQLDVISGDVYFRNQYYHLAKARVNFDNPFRIAPNINVEASSLILGYDVTVRAEGELSKPKLFFSSRPSLPQTDLVSLIMFGFTTRDNKDNLGLARTAGLEALSIYSGFGDEVLKTLPNQTFDELRLGTLYNQTGGAVSSVVLGMQVFNGVRLRFHSALVQNSLGTREKRLELEKYISRHLRWRVVWNSEGITNYGDAGADLWLRWDY